MIEAMIIISAFADTNKEFFTNLESKTSTQEEVREPTQTEDSKPILPLSQIII